jgi:hypothetical protein
VLGGQLVNGELVEDADKKRSSRLAGLQKVAGSLGIALGPQVTGVRPWLGDIALHDPQLAWTLLQSGRCAGGYVDTGGWEIFNLVGTFVDGTANETVQGVIQGLVEADLWVRLVTHTVRRPNAFAGNILKAQSDYYNSLNPNINFTLTINSYCRYLISPQQTPLENIGIGFECACPAGLVLRCSASIQSTFTLLRTVDADNQEIPMDAVITLHATRLPLGLYGQCGREQALALLTELGYFESV